MYPPSGLALEAHSGMGDLMDNPDHVDQRMVGATPPAIYDLKPREKPFHGVRALRMTPAEGTSALGRVGLLTHNYTLGPRGDSNGCVSIRFYDRFIKAYDDGEFNRLVVVREPERTATASAAAHRPHRTLDFVWGGGAAVWASFAVLVQKQPMSDPSSSDTPLRTTFKIPPERGHAGDSHRRPGLSLPHQFQLPSNGWNSARCMTTPSSAARRRRR